MSRSDPAAAVPQVRPPELAGAEVLVAGAGVSGAAAARALLAAGALVTVADSAGWRLAALRENPQLAPVRVWQLPGQPQDARLPEATELVVTSPGWRPDTPLLSRARDRGLEVIGEVELAWRLDQATGAPAHWLVVTGTNGKTTTTGMLAEILRAAGRDAVACGNIGLPAVDAVLAGHEVLAVELSSFQLHYAPSVRPTAGVVLNLVEDHLDWHGGMAEYAAAKARALTGRTAIAGVDDPAAAALLEASPAARKLEVSVFPPAAGGRGACGEPQRPRYGVARPASGAMLADPSGRELVAADRVRPQGPPGQLDALAAAALAGCVGVQPAAVAAGLGAYRPGEHRGTVLAREGGVRYVDDSKATNPHAASHAVRAHDRVVWLAGGLLKGAAVDELVTEVAGHLVAVVLFGTDAPVLADALARHAPDVPVHLIDSRDDAAMTGSTHPEPQRGEQIMREAIRYARRCARSGDAVVLAPAAASMDQFTDYRHRGRAFADAVAAAMGAPPGGER